MFDIFTKLAKKKLDAAGQYYQIARDIAGGQDVDENAVEAMLAASGKTLEDLRATVEVIKRHDMAVEIAKPENDLMEQRRRMSAEQNAVVAESAQAVEKFKLRLQKMEEQAQKIEGEYRAAGRARNEAAGIENGNPELAKAMSWISQLPNPPATPTTMPSTSPIIINRGFGGVK